MGAMRAILPSTNPISLLNQPQILSFRSQKMSPKTIRARAVAPSGGIATTVGGIGMVTTIGAMATTSGIAIAVGAIATTSGIAIPTGGLGIATTVGGGMITIVGIPTYGAGMTTTVAGIITIGAGTTTSGDVCSRRP